MIIVSSVALKEGWRDSQLLACLLAARSLTILRMHGTEFTARAVARDLEGEEYSDLNPIDIPNGFNTCWSG